MNTALHWFLGLAQYIYIFLFATINLFWVTWSDRKSIAEGNSLSIFERVTGLEKQLSELLAFGLVPTGQVKRFQRAGK